MEVPTRTAGRSALDTGGWWTHGLPPKSGTVTADAAQRIAAIGGTGRHDFRAGWTGTTGATRAVRPRPSALQVAAARAGRSSSTTRSAARPRAGPSDSPPTGARGSTPGSTSPPHAALPQPWPLAHVALARHPVPRRRPAGGRGPPGQWQPHRPPQPVRETWSTGAEVAGAPWQTRRPPPREARSGRLRTSPQTAARGGHSGERGALAAGAGDRLRVAARHAAGGRAGAVGRGAAREGMSLPEFVVTAVEAGLRSQVICGRRAAGCAQGFETVP